MPFAAPYTAMQQFTAPARKYPAIWRILLGIAVMLAVYALSIAVLSGVATAVTPDIQDMGDLSQLLEGHGTRGALWTLGSFGGMALAACAAALVHWRRPRTLFGPGGRMLRHFVLGFLVTSLFGAASFCVLVFTQDLSPGLDRSTWQRLLPLALVLLLIQTGAEELVFRGYLQQQLGARFQNPLIWLVLPSLLFGALHFEPSAPPVAIALILCATGLFGLIAADLTARTGSIGAGWGIHMANNIAAILLVSMSDSLNGLALFRTDFSPETLPRFVPIILFDIAITCAIWVTLRRLLSKGETIPS